MEEEVEFTRTEIASVSPPKKKQKTDEEGEKTGAALIDRVNKTLSKLEKSVRFDYGKDSVSQNTY